MEVVIFNCWKVGAPPELASLLEEIARESHPTHALREIGDDPELDEFMVFFSFYLKVISFGRDTFCLS